MLVLIHVFNLFGFLDSIFMDFGCQVEVSLGANITPKSFRNGAGLGDESASCFRAWRGVEGSWGFLEANS